MKHLILLFLFFCSVSCSSNAQEQPVPTSSADTIPAQKITLLFAGDLMQHQAQIDAARTATGYDYTDYFKLIKEEIGKADIAIGNLEVTLGGKPYRGYPAFSAPDEYLTAIKDAGFNVLITANNHCLDRGKKGLERTILMLDSLQIPYGTNGIKVSAPNIVNYIDKDIMARDIETAKALNPDALIACMHWGIEYQSLPNKEQTSLADWLLSRGVTHVIGSHPHVVQPMELRTDTLSGQQNVVLYSLGNFISNMSARKTDGGLLFKLELTKDSIGTSVSNCGYSLIWTARPTLSKKKNYVLYPASIPTDSLSAEERNRLKIFINDTRELFRKHNRGINEYIF